MIENKKNQCEDEKFCKTIFDRISCRTNSANNEIRWYFTFVIRNGSLYFTGEFDTTYDSPEDAWKRLRKFAEDHTYPVRIGRKRKNV